MATPPESPSWSMGGAKLSSDGVNTLDIISEEGSSRPRSQTLPSTFPFHCLGSRSINHFISYDSLLLHTYTHSIIIVTRIGPVFGATLMVQNLCLEQKMHLVAVWYCFNMVCLYVIDQLARISTI